MSLSKDSLTWMFAGLNLLQGAVIGAVPFFVPARSAVVNWSLGAAAILMLVAAPALLLAGRAGRIFALFACLLHGLIGAVFAVLIAMSAAYLYTIYGAQGQTVGAIAFVLVVVVAVAFWLLPAHELAFLRRKERSC